MKKNITRRELVLLCVLCVLALALAYFRLIYQPNYARLSGAQERLAAAESTLTADQTRLVYMRNMQQKLEDLKSNPAYQNSEVPSYDNIEQVMVALDGILRSAADYELTFSDPAVADRLSSRSVGLNFSADSFDSAEKILTALYNFPYRCLLHDITVSPRDSAEAQQADISKQAVSVKLTITLYEKIDQADRDPNRGEAPSAQGGEVGK